MLCCAIYYCGNLSVLIFLIIKKLKGEIHFIFSFKKLLHQKNLFQGIFHVLFFIIFKLENKSDAHNKFKGNI